MTSMIVRLVAISGLLTTSFLAIGSDKDLKQFFQASEKGFYQVLLDSAKNRKLTTQEILQARDANGNTLFGAALQSYPLALAKYGQTKAIELLYSVFGYLHNQLTKEDLLKLVNETNKAGIPPLFLAAKYGIAKIAVQLHGYGALSVTKGGKKASQSAAPAIKNILLPWENLEGDWVLIN